MVKTKTKLIQRNDGKFVLYVYNEKQQHGKFVYKYRTWAIKKKKSILKKSKSKSKSKSKAKPKAKPKAWTIPEPEPEAEAEAEAEEEPPRYGCESFGELLRYLQVRFLKEKCTD